MVKNALSLTGQSCHLHLHHRLLRLLVELFFQRIAFLELQLKLFVLVIGLTLLEDLNSSSLIPTPILLWLLVSQPLLHQFSSMVFNKDPMLLPELVERWSWNLCFCAGAGIWDQLQLVVPQFEFYCLRQAGQRCCSSYHWCVACWHFHQSEQSQQQRSICHPLWSNQWACER